MCQKSRIEVVDGVSDMSRTTSANMVNCPVLRILHEGLRRHFCGVPRSTEASLSRTYQLLP